MFLEPEATAPVTLLLGKAECQSNLCQTAGEVSTWNNSLFPWGPFGNTYYKTHTGLSTWQQHA